MKNQYLKYLNTHLEVIKDKISEDFTTLNFTDGRHPRERIPYVNDEDINVQVASVEIEDVHIKNQDEHSITFKLVSKILFDVSLSFPDLDTQYYDDDEQEVRTLNTDTHRINSRHYVIPIEVVINLEDDEAVEIESISLEVNQPIPISW
ncbi:hypothetical protein [Nostoc sp. FACHB-190]|uniref:hypothetical protein n=1 Tax=Nostoc sp. FACHB-190 TaxID=2692838 RepID=UPI0016898CDA|nr:hypothetical protein [Nostoc sp. FACHB-190]MBD2303839.1 hypothetical protein [Nostoc sp. FACHB-190]